MPHLHHSAVLRLVHRLWAGSFLLLLPTHFCLAVFTTKRFPPSHPPRSPETWPAQCPAFWFRPTGPGNVNFMGSLGKNQLPPYVFIINCYFRKTQDNRSTGIRSKKEHPGRAFIQGRSVQECTGVYRMLGSPSAATFHAFSCC